jgi:hypothetical protein
MKPSYIVAIMKMKRLGAQHNKSRRNMILGLLLIAISVAGVWLVIEANNRTEEFLVAAKPASSGSVITDSSFRVVRMNLGESAQLYLKPGDLEAGNYLLNTMEVGQLVALGSVASAILDARQPVVIASTMPLPQGVGVGDFVDIWVSESQEGGSFAAPMTLVLDAEIVDVAEASGVMADEQPRVQVLVPVESVSPILDAVASKDALSMILKRNLGND